MSCAVVILIFSLFILYSTSFVTSFNITKILSDDSDFSSFNQALTQTNVADEINNHKTITVLAVDNSKISSLMGQSKDTLQKILQIHVLLQYYDVDGFKSLPNKTSSIPTLYQASSRAHGQEGFVNVIEEDGQILLGSATSGSQMGATLVKSVFKQPYNISVVQISEPIDPFSGRSSPPSPSKPPAKAPSPAHAKAPAGSPEPAAADTPGSPVASPPGPSGPDADISPSSEKSAVVIVEMNNPIMLLLALSSAWTVPMMI